MDDMTAFEGQLTTVLRRMGGPQPEFDAMAIARSAVASTPPARRSVITRLRRGSMTAPTKEGLHLFSAVRLVAAGVSVVLFGGFLLAGILSTPQGDEVHPAAVTASPSPMTSTELLSGMVTEEVEPGVFRIVDDGVRDIARLGGGPYWGQHAMVDRTGAVWRIVQVERFFRLGREEEWPLDGQPVLAFADGRLVTAPELPDVLGWRSATAEGLGLDSPLLSIEVQDDGTAWLLDDGGTLVRVPQDGVPEAIDWKQAYDGAVDGRNLVVTADGEAWLLGRRLTDLGPIDGFLRFDGAEWDVVPAPEAVARLGDSRGWGATFDVGPDGTLWTVGDVLRPHRHLARYDGSGWTSFGPTDGVRPWGGQPVGVWRSGFDVVRVAPDGGVWVNGAVPEDDLMDVGCDGLGRFDGGSWASFLPGTCVYDLDFAPDGAVWVVASELRDVYTDEIGLRIVDAQTYVITPEAARTTG